MEATKTETEIEVLRREIEQLKRQNHALEKENETHEQHECEDNPNHVRMLELFADPSNWKDEKTWSPVMGYVERDPITLARSVL